MASDDDTSTTQDSDGDGLPDYVDTDSDNDGVDDGAVIGEVTPDMGLPRTDMASLADLQMDDSQPADSGVDDHQVRDAHPSQRFWRESTMD